MPLARKARIFWPVLLLVITAFIFMTALLPYVEWLCRRGVPRVAAVLIMLLAVLSLLGGMIAIVVPAVVNEFRDLRDNLPQEARKFEEFAADLGFAHATAIRAFLSEAEAAAAVGELAQAEAALAAFEAVTNGTRPPWSATLLHRARASVLVARGNLEAASAELEAAVATDNGLLPDHGRALLALGSLSRKRRQYARARDLLGQSLALFEGLGARPWIDRASAELARIPGRRSTEQHGLTDAETRIAELVAGGRTNRDVAAALFLSVKTVEVTLTHIYQKLGVRSRTELAHRFREPPKL